MKRILITAVAIVLFAAASQAQDGGRHHGKGGDRMTQELQLTDAQKAALKTIREAQQKEISALQANDNITVGESKAQRKALHDKYQSQVEQVLTPAQKDTLAKRKAEGKDRNMGKRGAKAGRGQDFDKQAAFFKKELNLSAGQEAKLKTIFQDFQTKAKDLRANTSLTEEQKREQYRSLSKQYMDQGKTVLNTEQLKKLDDMKGKQKHKLNRNL